MRPPWFCRTGLGNSSQRVCYLERLCGIDAAIVRCALRKSLCSHATAEGVPISSQVSHVRRRIPHQKKNEKNEKTVYIRTTQPTIPASIASIPSIMPRDNTIDYINNNSTEICNMSSSSSIEEPFTSWHGSVTYTYTQDQYFKENTLRQFPHIFIFYRRTRHRLQLSLYLACRMA